MNFVSRHPAISRKGAQAERFAEVYQQLGMLWEFLALQCGHTEGWRKTREGAVVCKTCGTARNVTERWLLLPHQGRKIVGRRLFPNSSKTFPSKKAASIVNDRIDFHGVKVVVGVHNAYRSRLMRRDKAVTIASDRIVQIHEDGIEGWFDTDLVEIKVRKRAAQNLRPTTLSLSSCRSECSNGPAAGRIRWKGKLVGVTISRPAPATRRTKPARTRSGKKQIRRRSTA